MLDITLHQIFFESAIDIHILIGLITLAIGLSGIFISIVFKRPWVFRIKLAIAFMMPVLSGIGNIIIRPQEFYMIYNSLNLTFLLMITILYWREVKEFMTTQGYHKKSLGTYIDDIHDLIWVKDVEYRYTYANKAVVKAMGIDLKDILGKNDIDIRLMMEKRDLRYDFKNTYSKSELNSISDPKLFFESGYIGDRFIALQICKGALYNDEYQHYKNHVGYIGIGRDLTYDIEDHANISKLFDENKIIEARLLFERHKSRHEVETNPTSNISN